MKTAIIGAGISGLSIARLLADKGIQARVFEKQSTPGGLVRCIDVNGSLFHKTGGHCFNSRRKDVLDWFWSLGPDPDQDFSKLRRNAVVSLEDGTLVQYPIENHVYQMKPDVQQAVIGDLLALHASTGTADIHNFDEFLSRRFGQTLNSIYFRPYNEKIWRRSLTEVPISWLEGKLPMPTIEEILYANFNHKNEDQMVHSSFYASKHRGSQFIVDSLAKGLDIVCNADTSRIEHRNGQWYVMEEAFDKVVFAGNSKFLQDSLLGDIDFGSALDGLKTLDHHGTTAALCALNPNPYSWIYMPSKKHGAHRIICTGNYWGGNNAPGLCTGTVEFSEKMTREEIEAQLREVPFNPQYLAHHYEEYTYPVQDDSTRGIINMAKGSLEPHGFYLLGRFAEWEYYNMDAAMGAALDLAKRAF